MSIVVNADRPDRDFHHSYRSAAATQFQATQPVHTAGFGMSPGRVRRRQFGGGIRRPGSACSCQFWQEHLDTNTLQRRGVAPNVHCSLKPAS
jgi:hypothetical protein